MAAAAGTLLLTSAVGFLAAFACLYAGRTFWRTRPRQALQERAWLLLWAPRCEEGP